jgi:diacylglycerol O-acyltransferase
MRASDEFTWHMERDPALRSTIVVVIWLDRPPGWDVLTARIDRMTRLIPSLRQHVVESPFRLTPPRWTYDPHFDLGWHLRRVTASQPRTAEAVMEMARRTAMAAFDRARPLWELTLIEGIKGGGAVLLLKLHHSLSDGVGGIQLLTALCDIEREPGDLGEMPPAPAGEMLGLPAMVAGAASSAAGRTARTVRHGAGAAVPAMLRSMRHPIAHVGGAAAMVRSVYRTAAPILDTKSPVMRDRAMTRTLATMEVPVEVLKKAARAAGATLNDVYLTAVTGGLRRYHERHGATVDSLRVTVPVNIRASGDVSWGNRITLQRVTVPVGEPDPAARMREVHRVIDGVRKEPSLPVTNAIAGALNMLPASYVGGVLKHIDFLASDVPGLSIPVYLAGSKITHFFAFGPTIGSAFNSTLVSYLGTCHIGINIDTAAVPDPEVLLDSLAESFAEIESLGAAGKALRPGGPETCPD